MKHLVLMGAAGRWAVAVFFLCFWPMALSAAEETKANWNSLRTAIPQAEQMMADRQPDGARRALALLRESGAARLTLFGATPGFAPDERIQALELLARASWWAHADLELGTRAAERLVALRPGNVHALRLRLETLAALPRTSERTAKAAQIYADYIRFTQTAVGQWPYQVGFAENALSDRAVALTAQTNDTEPVCSFVTRMLREGRGQEMIWFMNPETFRLFDVGGLTSARKVDLDNDGVTEFHTEGRIGKTRCSRHDFYKPQGTDGVKPQPMAEWARQGECNRPLAFLRYRGKNYVRLGWQEILTYEEGRFRSLCRIEVATDFSQTFVDKECSHPACDAMAAQARSLLADPGTPRTGTKILGPPHNLWRVDINNDGTPEMFAAYDYRAAEPFPPELRYFQLRVYADDEAPWRYEQHYGYQVQDAGGTFREPRAVTPRIFDIVFNPPFAVIPFAFDGKIYLAFVYTANGLDYDLRAVLMEGDGARDLGLVRVRNARINAAMQPAEDAP